jgi:hypothetical protein
VFILQIPASYAQQIRERAAPPARPASSPLLQAFNKAVIAADDPLMGSAFILQSKNLPDRGGIC